MLAAGLGFGDRALDAAGLSRPADRRHRAVVSFQGARLLESIDWLALRDLPVGNGRVDLKVERYAQGVGVEVLRNDGGASVRINL